MSAEAWPLFVRDGVVRAERIAEGIDVPGAPRTSAAADAATLATTCALLGLEELSDLARVVERGLDALGRSSPPPAPTLLGAVHAAADVLKTSFATLAAPDASGARIDPGTGDAERRALEALIGPLDPETVPPTAEPMTPEASGSDADARADADAGVGTWVPTVDEDMLDLFFQEADERLDALSTKLLELEDRPDDGEYIRELFRDLHTLKGSSGMVGLRAMNQLAHAAEDLVGKLRDGERRADRPVVDALLGALDGLRAILDRARHRAPIDVVTGPLVDRLRDPAKAAPAAPAAALTPTATADSAEPEKKAATAQKQTLRVDFDKLDLLLNLVGELVLARSGLTEGIQGLGGLGRELGVSRRLVKRRGPRRVGAPAVEADGIALRAIGDDLGRMERVFTDVSQDLLTSSDRLHQVSGELRDQVMKLRMIPIGGTFRKYGRTVRDLANTLGKKVKLVLLGEDTELDKVLVEQLEDPLLHLVRNAVDHGLERPEVRAAAGKPPEGTITLNAFHRGNTIVIEIRDDGAGIDPERLKAKALEKGVATADELASMDDRRALELIFRPGFSTAAKVTDVSGRGVGMDVVRETIVSRLKGSVDVTSTPGQGSTFTLKLPLTLAVIQVLLLGAGGDVFAIPLDVVTRTLTVAPADIHRVMDREVLHVAGKQIPLVRLRDVLELESLADHSDEHLFAILVEVFGQTHGIVCERLLGKQEVVIKTLGDLLEDVWGAAGATLLGDRCVLILNIAELIQGAARRPTPLPPAVPGGGAAAPARARARGAKILLVEDSDTVRESLRRLLVGAGHEVVEAHDGQEGLAIAESGDFDLISTDVMMPHLDGYDLTRALRGGRHRDTPIVMVTSRGEKIDQIRGFDAGVDAYITKPHDRQDYLKTVAKLLGQRGGHHDGGDHG